MTVPTPEQQVRFLTNVQRLLAEGQFVATYKYALLLALADTAVQTGDDSGAPLAIPTKQIAEKLIQYYWRQVVPYVPKHDASVGGVLRQNTGKQAAIIRQIIDARRDYSDSLVQAQRNESGWKQLVSGVDQVVRQMPLWKLQTVGRSNFDFLYENRGKGTTIELRPGVAYCLRQFYGLIGDLVRGAWLRYVRRHNHELLGTTADLSEFLFGSERSDLSGIREILEDVQSGQCFYCEKAMRKPGHVDHFIPWSRYPLDLGHNFVIAHSGCNSSKADHLASSDHLEAWVERNDNHRGQLADHFVQRGIVHDLSTSLQIANWAYKQAFDAGGLTWSRKDQMEPLPADWQSLMTTIIETIGLNGN